MNIFHSINSFIFTSSWSWPEAMSANITDAKIIIGAIAIDAWFLTKCVGYGGQKKDSSHGKEKRIHFCLNIFLKKLNLFLEKIWDIL